MRIHSFFSIKEQFEVMSRFYLSAHAVEAGSSCSDMVIQCLFSYSTILHLLPNCCYRMTHISHGSVSSMHIWRIDDVLERPAGNRLRASTASCSYPQRGRQYHWAWPCTSSHPSNCCNRRTWISSRPWVRSLESCKWNQHLCPGK